MSTDITTPERHPALREMIRDLFNIAQIDEETGDEFTMDIMEKLLQSESEEELFERQSAGTIAGRDFVGRPFMLSDADITWKKSSRAFIEQGAFPVYALLRVTEITSGEEFVIDCGGKTFVTVLRKLQMLGSFDKHGPKGRPFMISSKATAAGAVLFLNPVAQGRSDGKSKKV